MTTAIDNAVRLGTDFSKHTDNDGKYIAIAISLGIVAGPDQVGDFTPNEEATTGFKSGCLAHYNRNIASDTYYVVTNEAEGSVKVVDKGATGAACLTVMHCVSLTASELGKVKGHRDDRTTLKGLVASIRDAANKYVDNKLSRLRGAAGKARGPKAPTRDFFTYLDDTMNAVWKRAKKDGVCSEAEFRVAKTALIQRLKNDADKSAKG